MKAIVIFTLVICCIGVESFPGVRAKRETATGCSFLFSPIGQRPSEFWPQLFPMVKRYQVFWDGAVTRSQMQQKWQESRVACQALGGDLAEPSTPEEQDKILAAIDKFPRGEASSQAYWIGLEKKTADANWVSGKNVDLDSGLKFSPGSQLDDKLQLNKCGLIGSMTNGIKLADCDYGLAGYVCEFENAAPICIQ